ncbi:unnamed protein product [Gongylonema pulchrum]|uniref:WH2 domain-containing protein n=1 Tax=Gongylonema pulchrum TaxID=637853 RepID=A0A183EC61_9BILA|nr:unnamed protein product [Gongylonema pulchrum]
MISNEPQRTASAPEPVADKNEKIESESPAVRNTENSVVTGGDGIANQSQLLEKQTCEKQVPLLGESEVTNNDTGNVSRPTLAIQSGSMPPPPPPPPPPSSITAPKIAVTSGDDRANLMEAIRRAGGTKGAKLRSVKKRQARAKCFQKLCMMCLQEEELAEDVSALPKRNTTVAEGDLMSSLAKALEQRRKGIAGRIAENKERAKPNSFSEGAFAKMSARIPPPPPRKEDSDEQDDSDKADECDWE